MINNILNLLGYNPDGARKIINFRLFVMILFVLGILFITINLSKASVECPKTETKYVYVHKRFNEDKQSPLSLEEVYKPMYNFK